MCFSYSVNLNAQSLQSKLNLGEIIIPNPGFFFSGFTHPFLPVIVGKTRENPSSRLVQISEENAIDWGVDMQGKSMRWGLIPAWVKEVVKAEELAVYGLNARGETLLEKPMFREAWKQSPCLIPASGFFEWKTVGKKKRPYYIFPTNEDFFLFAGLYSNWINPETGEEISTFSIITTEANALMSDIHNTKQRMPAIIPMNLAQQFLVDSVENRSNFLVPYSDDAMKAHPVSPLASNSRVNRNVVSVLQPFSEDYSQTLF